MPGLYTISGALSRLEGKWKLKHPDASHFRVFQNKGFLAMLFGYASDYWWVQHKTAKDFPLLGPYRSRGEADKVVFDLVAALKEKYGLH